MKKLIPLFFLVAFAYSSCIAQTTHLVLSSRSFHPNSINDTLNTMKIVDQLKPSRLDWIYCESSSVLSLFKQRNLPFSLAIHPEVPDSAGVYTTKKLRIVDINGTPYIPDWMKGSSDKNLYWGCVNNPGFQALFLKKSEQYIDLGAYAIFVDDPIFNVQLQQDRPNKYGCFCDYCINGFSTYLAAHSQYGYIAPNVLKQRLRRILSTERFSNNSNNDILVLYQKYQRESVINFLRDWKQKISAYKPGIKTLCNNYNGSWNDVTSVYDGGICELSIDHLNVPFLDSVYAVVNSLHKTQLFSLVSSNVNAHNYLMAYCFKRGHDYLIPWDVYIPYNGGKRFYTNADKLKKLSGDIQTGRVQIEMKDKDLISRPSNDNGLFKMKSGAQSNVIQLYSIPDKKQQLP